MTGEGAPSEPELALQMIKRVVVGLVIAILFLLEYWQYTSNKLLEEGLFASSVDDKGNVTPGADYAKRIRAEAKIFSNIPISAF